MEISGEYSLAAARHVVWAALNNPLVLEKCIPGCESMAVVGENQWQATVAAAIGPVRARFNTRVSIENQQPPVSYTLLGESKAAAGFAKGKADVVLSEQNGGTLLVYTAEFRVGGKLAQVGSRLVVAATRKTADEFFGALVTELDGKRAAASFGAGKSAALRKVRWLMAGSILLVLGILWFVLR